MISPDEALRLVLDAATPLPPVALPLADALDLILAEPVASDRDDPPFDRAMMDGYAVRLAGAGRSSLVIGEIAAGSSFASSLDDGQAIEIMTGAPCPPGTEAVVPKEDVRREANRVMLPAAIRPQQNIAPRASVCRAGQTILEPGTAVTPLVIGVLASAGRAQVSAIPRPHIAIVTTGEELVSETDWPGAAQIRDSNGPMLAAMASRLGLAEIHLAHARDTPDDLRAALDAADDADAIVLTGGVSAGKYDIVPGVLAERGARHVFHKVAQKPGKPFLFAVRERPTRSSFGPPQLFFGLPGNPLACHLCFHRYVAAAVRKMTGLPPASPPLAGRLTEPFSVTGPRVLFQLARAERNDGGDWLLTALRGRGSADLINPAAANALIRLDPQAPPTESKNISFELLHPLS
jgi:molybdopterin molybdotransferase